MRTERDVVPAGRRAGPRTGRHRIAVVGDVLLDRDLVGRSDRLSPEAPVPVVDVEQVHVSPGGAGLVALLCCAPDVDVTLVAPLAADEDGDTLRAALTAAGVQVLVMGHEGPTRRKTRVRSAGHLLLRLDDGGPGLPVDVPTEAVRRALRAADVVLVSDYGGGTTCDVVLRDVLTATAAHGSVVWDPHPRGGPPVPGRTLVTPNLAEARAAAGPAAGPARAGEVAATLRDSWQAKAVCATAGADGAWLATSATETLFVPAPRVTSGDACGAGDRFVASAAQALARGAALPDAVAAAVGDATAWVAAGGVVTVRPSVDGAARRRGRGTAPPGPSSAGAVRDRIRAAGGTLVATGGCFDVLHAGHVASLDAARRLGDALVVLLNSDESVRRLKGPGRPAQPAADRARVLTGLASVDAVVVFDEDDPSAALAHLRPDVWAKGGDYDGATLPEADLVRSWGGRVVLLPYLAGRSTTEILGRSPTDGALLGAASAAT